MYKRVIKYGATFVAGLVATKVLKSDTMKKACVNVMAEGMKAKDEFDKRVEEIKAGAEDLVAEAREKKAQEEILVEEVIVEE